MFRKRKHPQWKRHFRSIVLSAVVQKMIVNPRCLKAAVEYVGPNSQYANVLEVTKIAQLFVDWVMDDKIPEEKKNKKMKKKETTDLPF